MDDLIEQISLIVNQNDKTEKTPVVLTLAEYSQHPE